MTEMALRYFTCSSKKILYLQLKIIVITPYTDNDGIMAGGAIPPPLPLNFSLSRYFFQKIQNLIWNIFPIFGEFGSKIEILSIHDCLCWKFAAVCLKIETSCSPTFYNPVSTLLSI